MGDEYFIETRERTSGRVKAEVTDGAVYIAFGKGTNCSKIHTNTESLRLLVSK